MNLTVSRKAEKFIRRMITFSGTAGGFRLAVKEGGCSGLSYDFSIEAEPAATDAVVTATRTSAPLSQVIFFIKTLFPWVIAKEFLSDVGPTSDRVRG
mgnify:CR=1 FL=1